MSTKKPGSISEVPRTKVTEEVNAVSALGDRPGIEGYTCSSHRASDENSDEGSYCSLNPAVMPQFKGT